MAHNTFNYEEYHFSSSKWHVLYATKATFQFKNGKLKTSKGKPLYDYGKEEKNV